MGIQLQHPQAELKNVLTPSVLLHWSLRLRLGNWNVLWAFCKIGGFVCCCCCFLTLCSQFSKQARTFLLMVEQLKVTANFSLYFYHMLQMPLRCFFPCYLKMLCCIDFCFFSKGLKISAVTLKLTKIIDYLFLTSSSVIYLMSFNGERVCYF